MLPTFVAVTGAAVVVAVSVVAVVLTKCQRSFGRLGLVLRQLLDQLRTDVQQPRAQKRTGVAVAASAVVEVVVVVVLPDLYCVWRW